MVPADSEDCPIFGQLITFKQDQGIRCLSKSHFKLLVWVVMCMVKAVETDKWCRQAMSCVGAGVLASVG